MKKIKIFGIIFLFIFIFNSIDLYAEDQDYLTYQEIIMSSGKLIKNYTEEEINSLMHSQTYKAHGEIITIDNQNVQASYISRVTELMENSSSSSIVYDVSYQVETSMKVSFSFSGTFSAEASGKIGAIKSEVSAKIGIDYSTMETRSEKENRVLKVNVDPNSQYMVVIKGNLTVTNGLYELYLFFVRIRYGLFEIVTLQSQYAALEKRSLWKKYLYYCFYYQY